jgi:hypothetical protein
MVNQGMMVMQGSGGIYGVILIINIIRPTANPMRDKTLHKNITGVTSYAESL